MTIKATCDCCGEVLRIIRIKDDLLGLPNLCDGCRAITEEWKWKSREISKGIDDIASNLKLKGVQMRADVETFETKLISGFIEYGKSKMDSYLKTLEKEVKHENGRRSPNART